MVAQTFAVKYIPKFLNQFHISKELHDTITTFVRIEKLNILLVGNSGSGKTSLIRAIVREYYGHNIDLNHQNILYINTLKEQGISYYRNEVRVFCQSPSYITGKKKIIILDDLDIINEHGQQVFRNCIDKYSQNVCFISSCVNVQKIIDSIQSRVDILRITPHTLRDLTDVANNIIVNEHIQVGSGVVDFIVCVCNGSVRILVNYLEKFKLMNREIDTELASQLCTNISFKELLCYTNACIATDINLAISIINSFVDKGYSVTDILDSYFTFLKYTDLLSEDMKYRIIPYICKYITIFHNIHEDEIELIFFTNNIISILSGKNIDIII
jgi:DNA polymerase III gamma/tau subunit